MLKKQPINDWKMFLFRGQKLKFSFSLLNNFCLLKMDKLEDVELFNEAKIRIVGYLGQCPRSSTHTDVLHGLFGTSGISNLAAKIATCKDGELIEFASRLVQLWIRENENCKSEQP